MSKKSFRDLNPAMQFISTDTHDTQHVYDAQEAQEAKKPVSRATQGRKGQKLPRINMAFSPENLEYLQVISGFEHMSMTEYVNRLIETDMKKNSDLIGALDKLKRG